MKKIEPKRRAQLKRLANRIAKALFTEGHTHKRVARLVMAHKQGLAERFGAGWSEKPVCDLILRHLLKAEERRVQR